ncbi:MAG: c-type cytochrome [Bacteroidota bacterium]
MYHRILTTLCSATSLAIVFTLVSKAQQQWSWPEQTKNLQVLPKDTPSSKLRPLMGGFTRALGVRCWYCHSGQEGKPLNTYDFASDDNPNKNRAREMLRMLGSIEDHLKKIEPSGDRRVEVGCSTCHRGRPRPMTLEEELGETYRMKGLDSALQHYADLKESFYGRGAYDFGERALNNFGYQVLANDATGAVRVFKSNAKEFPKSPNVWDSLADAYMKAGDPKRAKQCYGKVLKLDPQNENAKEMLKKIKAGAEK